MTQQLFEVENKNTDRNWQRKLYEFKPPISVLRYISKITSQMYFGTSSFEKLYFATSRK